MIHPHNPVMQRLGEMARRWQEDVRPTHRLVRWLLKPEDHRMYEGFCRLEASPHGSLNNLFLFFYTPFAEAETYSHALMENWLREYEENTEQRKLLQVSGVQGDWDVSVFREAVDANRYTLCNVLLPQMLKTYRDWLGLPGSDIVLALLPKELYAPAAFKAWLQGWMQRDLPEGVQLLVFDHISGNFYGEVFAQFPDHSRSLEQDLRMEAAIREIATAGAGSDPHASFRECLFGMGEAVGKRDRPGLQEWGEKALAIGKRSGDGLLLATAYIAYAGMLFHFKAWEKISELLDAGMLLCQRGIQRGEEPMKSLLLQYYAYQGANCQLQKQRREALDWFLRMGELAEGFGYYTQALSAWYKAFVFARHKNYYEEQGKALLAAMLLTDKLQTDEVLVSEYPFLAAAFLGEEKREEALREKVGVKMEEAFGPDWREQVEELEKNYTRQRVREMEQAAMAEE